MASKVTALLKQLLGAVIVVTVPRLACLYGQKGGEFFQKLARQIADLLVILALPAACALFALGAEVADLDFAPAAGAMKLLGLALVFSLLGWFYMAAVLVPARQEKVALLAISIASVVNICLNFLLIPAFKEAGAALATLLADLVTCLACYFLAKKSARLLPSGKKLASSLLAVFMFTWFAKQRPRAWSDGLLGSPLGHPWLLCDFISAWQPGLAGI